MGCSKMNTKLTQNKKKKTNLGGGGGGGGGGMAVGNKRKKHHHPKSDTKLVVVYENPKATKRYKRKRAVEIQSDDDHSDSQVQPSAVMERAAEVQSNLDDKFPSFFKLMLRSHVTKGFWLALPAEFCKLHMPKHDATIVLEGEDMEEYETKFLFNKDGLSGGWKGFSIAHKLLEGDAVVFHLVQPCKFKVYIVRENGFAEVDGALGLLNLENCANETNFDCKEKDISMCMNTKENHLMPLSNAILQETGKEKDSLAVNSSLDPVTDESENDREVSIKEGIEDHRLSNSFVDIRKFKVVLNDCIIDSQLSKHLQAKYHELCCTKKSYLHQNLHKAINHTLAAGIISETINIADAIRASTVSTSLNNFTIWDKTLEAFELLGMDVGFLRARLNRLLRIAIGSVEDVESIRYEEARYERQHAEEEVKTCELKLIELKQASSKLEKEMEVLKENAERYKLMFQKQVSAPW